jgi:hypothetical protein
MKRLALQAALHLSSRVLSVLLSFTLFAWVGKVLSPPDAVKAFQFLFILGFAVAASRASLHLVARVNGMARTSERMRSLHAGLSSQIWLLLPLGSMVCFSVWLSTRDIGLALLAVLIFLPAAFDADAVRSVLGRPSYFASAFSLGSALAIVAIETILPSTLHGVMMAFLIQWLPVCALNLFLVLRHRRLLVVKPLQAAILSKTLVAASFDGIVLNAPFFGIITLPTQDALDIGLIIRIFVAALPLLPLLMHWSNSPEFPLLCKKLGLTTQIGFSIILMTSGLIFALVFAEFYHRTNSSQLNPFTYSGFIIILSTFSIYFSQARFSSVFLRSASALPILLTALGVYLVALKLLETGATVLLITTLQGLTFLTASYLLSRMGRTHSLTQNH